jgi:hypothetical protein
MKCSAIIGNLFRTRRWLGLEVGISAKWSADGGFSKGSIFFFGVVSSCFGVGFLASVGQKRSCIWVSSVLVWLVQDRDRNAYRNACRGADHSQLRRRKEQA